MPHHLRVHLVRILFHLHRVYNERDYEHAVEILERGLKLHESMPTASAMLGMSYYQLGQNAKAEPLIRAALTANLEDDQAELALAQVQIRQSEYQQAAGTLSHYLKRNPKEATRNLRPSDIVVTRF